MNHFYFSKILFFSRDDGRDGGDHTFPEELREKFKMFMDLFPNDIVTVGDKCAYLGEIGSSKYVLQARPCVDDTWHAVPRVDDSEGGELDNWSVRAEKDGFPKWMPFGSTNIVPKDLSSGKAKDMLPKGIKVSFARENKDYERFLSSPPLVKGKEAFLDGPFMKGPKNVKVSVDNNMVKIEKLSRDGIRESHGVIFMLEMMSEKLKETLAQEAGEWDPIAMLKLTHEWLDLTCRTAFRSGAYFQSVHVLAKDSLRKVILEGLWGRPETKDNIIHSHYATKEVFGPVSARFEPCILPTSYYHENYKLDVRYTSRGSSSQNYDSWPGPRGSSGANQNKRAANSGWGASNNKRGKQSNNVVKYSPQEILRRSLQNSNKGNQNQFFQKNGGKGNKSFRGKNRK